MEIKGLSDLNETLMSKMIKKYICKKSYSYILRYHVLIVFMKKSYTKVCHEVNHMNTLTNLTWCYVLKKKGTFWFLWYKCMKEEEEKKWKVFFQHNQLYNDISSKETCTKAPRHTKKEGPTQSKKQIRWHYYFISNSLLFLKNI